MQVIEVAAGLVFRKGKLLITQRRDHDSLGGYWEFPGGKRESGETHEACVRRELREELGIEVQVFEEVARVSHPYPGTTVHLRFFRCLWLQGEPQTLGCQALRWVGPVELSDFRFPPADTQLIQDLMAKPSWWLTPELEGAATRTPQSPP